MRKLLLSTVALVALSGSALAADFYDAPPAQEAAWNWTGLYLGGTGGFAFGDKGEFWLEDYPDVVVDHDLEGWVAGGFVGGNYQVGSVFVLGAEVTGLWSNIEGNKAIDDHFDTHSSIDGMLLAEGRLGLAWERALLFVSGGYAGADVNGSVDFKQGVGQSLGNRTTIFEDNEWAHGWTVGAGVDIKLTDNWFAGVKYNHIEFTDLKLADTWENWDINVNSNVQVDQVVGRIGFQF